MAARRHREGGQDREAGPVPWRSGRRRWAASAPVLFLTRNEERLMKEKKGKKSVANDTWVPHVFLSMLFTVPVLPEPTPYRKPLLQYVILRYVLELL